LLFVVTQVAKVALASAHADAKVLGGRKNVALAFSERWAAFDFLSYATPSY